MISDHDVLPHEPQRWLPFLDCEVADLALSRQAKFFRRLAKQHSVGMRSPPVSPSPSPTVPKRTSQISKKELMKSFVDKLPGRHRPKLDRASHILAYGQRYLDGRPICEFDHFLVTIFEQPDTGGIVNRDAIRLVWDQLQNDPQELPALWATDFHDDKPDRTDGMEGEPQNPEFLFPAPFPWQFIKPALGKLPLLGKLLGELSFSGWKPSMNGFAYCVLSVYRDHGSLDDCLDLLELLVGKLPHLYHRNLYVATKESSISAVDVEILNVFKRCWPTMQVFKFSADFWSSPWWDVFGSSELATKLVKALSRRVEVGWHVRSKPFEGPDAQALIEWTRARTRAGQQKKKNMEWIGLTYRLASVSGNPNFLDALKDLLAPVGNDLILSLQNEYEMLLEHIHTNDFSNEDVLWAVQGFYRRMVSSDQADGRAWRSMAVVHASLNAEVSEHPAYLAHLLRCCLRATIQSYESVSADVARDVRQQAANNYCNFYWKSMDVCEWRLLCLCWPWMPPYIAEVVANCIGQRIVDDFDESETTGYLSEFVSTLLNHQTLGLWVILHLSRWSTKMEGIQLLVDELVERDGGKINWSRAELGFLGDLLGLKRSSLRGDVKKIVYLFQPLIQMAKKFQPSCAKLNPSEDAFKAWLEWMGQAADNAGLKQCGGPHVFLTMVRRFGDWLLAGCLGSSGSWDIVGQFSRVLVHFSKKRWAGRLIPAEMVIAFLMPLLVYVRHSSASPSVWRRPLIKLREEFLSLIEGGPDGELTPYERDAYNARVAQVLAVLDVMPLVWGGAYLSVAGDIEPSPVEAAAKDVQHAYQLVARAALGFHLGSGKAEASLCEMGLRMAEATLQGRNDTAATVSVVLLALKRFSADLSDE